MHADLVAALTKSERPAHLHNAFRFPARLHHRVATELIGSYSKDADIICDPFVGSGTNQIEASLLGRSSYGLDVDPLSVFITKTKLSANSNVLGRLERLIPRFRSRLQQASRGERRYDELMFKDLHSVRLRHPTHLSDEVLQYLRAWFRNYVIEDLIRIRSEIFTIRDVDARQLLLLVFASIIRNCSRADPVPVSGLEITSRMLRLETEGRYIDPYDQYLRRLEQILEQVREYSELRSSNSLHVTWQGDASEPWTLPETAGLILFSPPYLNAVEYSRRHKLEMYWLGLVPSISAYRDLARRYIGQRWGGRKDTAAPGLPGSVSADFFKQLLAIDEGRARAFARYAARMNSVFRAARSALRRRRYCIAVIGSNRVAGLPAPMPGIFEELAAPLRLEADFSYALKDRYMSYARRNEANIGREHVLIFRKG